MAAARATRLPVVKARKVPPKTRLLLYVKAAGRCEFDGCNRYLMEHSVTKVDGNFAEMAHIYAFNPGGPRGRRGGRSSPHDISNLMLLGPECHKLIDEDPERYTVEVLQQFKQAHEDRIYSLTSTHPDRRTVALVVKGKVGDRTASVALSEIQSAVAPSYLTNRDVVTIDLTAFGDCSDKAYLESCHRAIKEGTRDLYARQFEDGPVRHVSVFALASIPLLVALGTQLSDKVPTKLYQRHRDTDTWKWKSSGANARYATHVVRQGARSDVAVVLSLSGKVMLADLPARVRGRCTVYELTLIGMTPNLGFLGREASLHAFRTSFQMLIRSIAADHPKLKRVHLFPAVPAPVAVEIGRSLLPKKDPALLVYDYDKRFGGFVPTLEVNA